ncbi:hypothetical protein B6U83_00700 [Thermoplasmatales archaeon ex4484_36]|nr:MAG: hypothetical protein B6U83_00700 [Thermoplasmatales archaeon ex4484_36]
MVDTEEGPVYLKKIVMENFKSFRGKVVIPLPQGFTGITGPNGSGKSNIADAILFIVGKSSKALRAQRQTDLIYNGGPRGKPASRCSVELIFDNTDRMIPYDADEVRFTKMVKRKGKGEDGEERYSAYYYLNGRRVTASEFDTLFTSSRISTDAYNIIQQGDVNQLVVMGPTDRRRVLEAISGIAKYDEEINRAMNQKAKAEEGIEKLEEKRREIEKEVRSLKKSVERALKYKELRERLKRLKMETLVKELYLALKEVETRREQLIKNSSEISELKGKLPRLESKIREAAEKVEKLDEEIARMGGEEVRRTKEKLDEARREYFQIKADIERAGDALAAEERELKDIRSRIGGLKKFLKEKRELAEKRSKLAAVEERLRSTEGMLQELRRGVEDLEERIETERYELRVAKQSLKETRRKVEEVERLEELKKKLISLKGEEGRLKKEIEKSTERIRKLDAQIRDKSAEVGGGKLTETARAVLEVLAYRDRREIDGIYGTVGELMEVPEEYSIAIQAAAGGLMHAIVVKDDEVMERCIRKLKEGRVGRAHFIPLNKVVPSKPRAKALMIEGEPDVIGFALNLIKFDERYRQALSYVFRDTIIVKDLKALRRHMGGVKLVTPEGDIADPGGGVFGGYTPKKATRKFDLLSATQEIRKLQEEMGRVTEERDRLLQEHREVSGEIIRIEKEIERLLATKEALGDHIQKYEEDVKKHQKSLQELQAQRKEALGRIEGLNKEREKLIGEMEALRGETEKLTAEKEALEERVRELMPQKLKEELKALKGKEGELSATLSELQKEHARVSTQVEGAGRELDSLKRREPEKIKHIEELREQIRASEGELDKKERAVKALEELMERMSEKQKDLYDAKHQWEMKQSELEAERREVKDRISILENFVLDIRRNIREAEKKAESLREQLLSYPGWEEVSAEALPALEDLNAEIRGIEREMEGMGDVNMEAVREYEMKSEALKKLKERLGTLKEERRCLERLIEETSKKKKERFMETFQNVNENFGEVFSRVTGGGQAKLTLENSEDPFQGGLHIWAQPPGKKVQRIEALSGGEKALTSICFIMAIQRYDPSPFYFFDEIDQNLDAVNAELVAKMIKKNSERAQFIVISLRKVTLKEADYLIGVLPREKGTSDVIARFNIEEVRPEWERSAEGAEKASEGGGENA